MNVASILILSACFLFPYCALMGIIAVIATKAKWKSATRILNNIEVGKYKNTQANKGLGIFIVISLMLILGLSAVCVVALVYDLYGPAIVSKMIDIRNFQVFIVSVLLFGVAGTGLLWLFWGKIWKDFNNKE